VTAIIEPTKWWIGLPPLAILFTIAATSETEKIESDIAARAKAVMASAPEAIAETHISVDGRDVHVSGVVLSRDAAETLLSSIEKQEGVRAVRNATAAPALAAPFDFTLERKGKRLSLTGHAPVSGEREALRAAASAKGLEVDDKASYATGAPKNFSALANYALSVLETLGDGKVALSDATLKIDGAAASFDAYDRAEAALAALPEGAKLQAAAIAPPRVSPFLWSAVKSGDMVSLFGYAPSQNIRDALAAEAAALAGAAHVADQSRIAGGAPAGDFTAAARLALGELGKLTHGKAALADGSLSIEGAGRANVAAATVETSARAALPQGFRLGAVAIAPGLVSPYVLTARKEGGTLSLAGYVPDDAAHARLTELAKRLSEGPIVDEIMVADGAPAGFVEAAAATLRALARLDTGAAALSDRKIAIDGAAYHAKAPDNIKSRLAAEAPRGFEQSARLGVETTVDEIAPAHLYAVLSDIVARGISFGSDNATIAPDSLPVVDSLAFTLLRSPGAAIGILGRYDGAGSEEANEEIGRRRAEAIKDYLIAAGVDAARLTAQGAGGAPGQDGDNALGRRIEFSIK
jgi:OOP family OmpA-OmpF porin